MSDQIAVSTRHSIVHWNSQSLPQSVIQSAPQPTSQSKVEQLINDKQTLSKVDQLTNEQLLAKLHQKSQEERNLTLEVIELLQEVEQRKLHLEKGYGSLLEFCVKELKYSESAAYRHISTMWAAKELPQVKESIQNGTLNVSTVTQAQTFFRQEKKYRAKNYTRSEKLMVLQELQNKSKRDVEKILIAKSPDLPKPEFVRRITETDTRMTITIDQKLVDQLDEIKIRYSHINPNPSYAELIGLMAEEVLRIRKLKQDKEATKSQRNVSPPVGKRCGKIRSRYIPAAVKHFIRMRDHGVCTYVDPKTNRHCGSRFQLEIDHIKPFSLGGTNEPSNLRLTCRNHNQFYWETYQKKWDPRE